MHRTLSYAVPFTCAAIVAASFTLLFAGASSSGTPYVSALSDAYPLAKPTPPLCDEFVCTEDPFTHRFVCDATLEQLNCTMKRGSLSCRTTAC